MPYVKHFSVLVRDKSFYSEFKLGRCSTSRGISEVDVVPIHITEKVLYPSGEIEKNDHLSTNSGLMSSVIKVSLITSL